ncbi:hypothetical protein ACEN2J_09915, partial [Pseudorhodobacter sp. W20_MBD10_FR17]|uniref:hypothetical protein n=1 Tax=Pseudorhodobacter sp. W20_MBD10_FR17 TaxID=3240266 RepID=UPI003F9CC461
GQKTLDRVAWLGDLEVKRQATWGMSVNELGVLGKGEEMKQIHTRARLGQLGAAGPDGIAFSKSMRRAWATP